MNVSYTCAARLRYLNNCWTTATAQTVAEHGIVHGIVCSAQSFRTGRPAWSASDPRAVITGRNELEPAALGRKFHKTAHVRVPSSRTSRAAHRHRLRRARPCTRTSPDHRRRFTPAASHVCVFWYCAWWRVHLFADTSCSYTQPDKHTHAHIHNDEKWRNVCERANRVRARFAKPLSRFFVVGGLAGPHALVHV